MSKKFVIKGTLYVFQIASPWFYISIPKDKVPKVKTGGWGSIPVMATIGKTRWRTSLFPLKKDNYFIPIKKSVRMKEGLTEGDPLTIQYETC